MTGARSLDRGSRLLPALLFLLSGCASIPPSVSELPESAGAIELEDTPFYPQERYQCGPAALTTVLNQSGAAVLLDDIVDKVYLPGRQGSLQVELLAATRTEGRLPYVIDGNLAAIRAELAAGRPVLVLQNLGVAAAIGDWSRWHYAVVVGIDADRDEIILRSGTDRRRVTATRPFLNTWRRGGYWGMVVLAPGELPASVERSRYFAALAAFEEAGRAAEAAVAWAAALGKWPGDTVALFGLGNSRLALGEYQAAEQAYRDLLQRDPAVIAARNNLALALAEQGQHHAALREIRIALAENRDAALEAELRNTAATIRRLSAGADE